jgi:hypothetical protein
MTQAARYCNRCGGRLARDNTDTRCAACSYAARDTLSRPQVIPPEFWDTDQVRDALATWHMGRVMYAYRMHPYHGRPLSQETVGNWLGLTQAQLSRIENGRAPEELSKLIRYAIILNIPAHLLWFKLPDAPIPAATVAYGGKIQFSSSPCGMNQWIVATSSQRVQALQPMRQPQHATCWPHSVMRPFPMKSGHQISSKSVRRHVSSPAGTTLAAAA